MLDHFEHIKAELTPAELIGWIKGNLVFLRVELAHEQRIEEMRGNGLDIIEFFKTQIIDSENALNAAIKAADEARYIGFGEVVPNPVCDFRARGVL